MDITINGTSFRAKLGKNILKNLNKEFKGDKTRVEKYVQLFDDTFSLNIDKETVVDITKKNYFIFSNTNFPDVKYQHDSKIRETKGIAKALINECSRTVGSGEDYLFKTIISKYLNRGMDFCELEQMVKKIFNPKSKESFMEKIKVAERIKKEFPKTKYSQDEFDYVQNIVMQEDAEILGTKMNELINSFMH